MRASYLCRNTTRVDIDNATGCPGAVIPHPRVFRDIKTIYKSACWCDLCRSTLQAFLSYWVQFVIGNCFKKMWTDKGRRKWVLPSQVALCNLEEISSQIVVFLSPRYCRMLILSLWVLKHFHFWSQLYSGTCFKDSPSFPFTSSFCNLHISIFGYDAWLMLYYQCDWRREWFLYFFDFVFLNKQLAVLRGPNSLFVCSVDQKVWTSCEYFW